MGEDIPVRNLQDGNTRLHFIKMATDLGFLDIQNASAEIVMMPETAPLGSLDEESQHYPSVLLRG